MVAAFLDTAILVDLLRNYSPALVWKNTQTGNVFGITPLVYMEIVEGVSNKQMQQNAIKFLLQFQMVYLTETDQRWAVQTHSTYHLSHSTGFSDCLIASVPYRLQVPLYTHNLKHLVPLLGALAQKPY